MDWQVVLTSVVTSLISSSVITAGIIYILKKSFDRAIDYRFEKSLEESRLHAQENTRRQATIYDKQLEILKEVLGLTYRLRNVTRDLAEQVGGEQQENEKEIRTTTKKLRNYREALIELMFEERALLPPLLFKLAHDLKNRTEALLLSVENIRFEKKSKPDDRLGRVRNQAIETYQQIDDLYQLMVNTVQAQIGVVKEKGESQP